MFKYKMAIVVRKDLELSPGKLAGQVAHAAIGCYRKTLEENMEDHQKEDLIWEWFYEGQAKIILQVPTEQDLQNLLAKCVLYKVPYYEVRDMGLTELEPDTFTCIGIGPELTENLNKITGNLKLYK
jgi:PTH2 family peptidyl-tRNA hydrolase